MQELPIELEAGDEVDHFVDVVRVMYGMPMVTSGENLLHVLKLAHKYEVPSAVLKCASELHSNMSVRTACAIAQLPPSLQSQEEVKVRTEVQLTVVGLGSCLQSNPV